MLDLDYESVWHRVPYTNSVLIDEVLTRRYYHDVENPWPHFWRVLGNEYNRSRGEGLFRTGVTAQHIDNMTIDDTLWKNDHGLCTSFAIRVAHEAGIEDFMSYGDNGRHRVAWVRSVDKIVDRLVGEMSYMEW